MTSQSIKKPPNLTHLKTDGTASMVDVAHKADTKRQATAQGWLKVNAQTLEAIQHGDMKKGDVIGTSRLAGIMAAKRTHELIPLCHPLPLSAIDVDISSDRANCLIKVTATVSVTGKTGVEMEALTAVSVACLTVYDMAKAVQKDMIIGPIQLIKKTGGKSGDIDISPLAK
ncbi:MAG: cyclic pyranopterin monophosphate synthase MoaC [Pseudomonadota bacterium]